MRLQQATPFLQVTDLKAALNLFTGLLGFEIGFQAHSPGYAYIHRDGAAFRLVENTCAEEQTHPTGRMAYYVDVQDIDALWAELEPRLKDFPGAYLRGPINQPYGMREIHILAPDGETLAFGEEV